MEKLDMQEKLTATTRETVKDFFKKAAATMALATTLFNTVPAMADDTVRLSTAITTQGIVYTDSAIYSIRGKNVSWQEVKSYAGHLKAMFNSELIDKNDFREGLLNSITADGKTQIHLFAKHDIKTLLEVAKHFPETMFTQDNNGHTVLGDALLSGNDLSKAVALQMISSNEGMGFHLERGDSRGADLYVGLSSNEKKLIEKSRNPDRIKISSLDTEVKDASLEKRLKKISTLELSDIEVVGKYYNGVVATAHFDSKGDLEGVGLDGLEHGEKDTSKKFWRGVESWNR